MKCITASVHVWEESFFFWVKMVQTATSCFQMTLNLIKLKLRHVELPQLIRLRWRPLQSCNANSCNVEVQCMSGEILESDTE